MQLCGQYGHPALAVKVSFSLLSFFYSLRLQPSLLASSGEERGERVVFAGQLLYFRFFRDLQLRRFWATHVDRKCSLRRMRNSTPVSNIGEAVPISLFWASNGLNELPEILFECLFNLIGRQTVALSTGQSQRVLKSWYTGGDPEQGFRRCFADGLWCRLPEMSPSPFNMPWGATKFVLLNVSTLIQTICPKLCSKLLPKNAKCPLPVGVRVLILLADFSPPDVRPNSRKNFKFHFQKYRTLNNGV